MDVSPHLEKYTYNKIRDKVEKFLSKPVEAKISFYVSKKQFGCHVYVGGNGGEFFVSHQAADMYTAVNYVVEKLESQLRRRKEKAGKHRFKSARQQKRQIEYLQA